MFNGRCIVKQVSLALSVILAGLAITAVSCDSEKPNAPAVRLARLRLPPCLTGRLCLRSGRLVKRTMTKG